jgi:hypothetical protein
MLPTDFKYRNLVLGKPKNMTDEECMSLPVWTNGNMYISKWKLNKEDLEMILQTGEIWFQVTSAVHPPICPSVEPLLEGDYVTVGDIVRCKVQIPGCEEIAGVEGPIDDIDGLLVVKHGKVSVPFYLCTDVEIIKDAD